MDYDKLLMPAEAARRLGIDPRTLQRWANRGLIEVVVLPTGHRRYPASAVEASRAASEQLVEAQRVS